MMLATTKVPIKLEDLVIRTLSQCCVSKGTTLSDGPLSNSIFYQLYLFFIQADFLDPVNIKKSSVCSRWSATNIGPLWKQDI